MNIKNLGILLFVMIFFGLLHSSCHKCWDEQETQDKYPLSSDEKAYIPYKGFDTIRFVNSSNDTIIFYGTGRNTYIDLSGETSNDGCSTIIHHLEHDTVSLKNKLKNYTIQLSYKKDVLGGVFAISINNEGGWIDHTFNHPLDSIELNGKYFYDVYNCGTIMYNHKYGVLQFSFWNKRWIWECWTLVK